MAYVKEIPLFDMQFNIEVSSQLTSAQNAIDWCTEGEAVAYHVLLV